jgi:hypothetical protein
MKYIKLILLFIVMIAIYGCKDDIQKRIVENIKMQ